MANLVLPIQNMLEPLQVPIELLLRGTRPMPSVPSAPRMRLSGPRWLAAIVTGLSRKARPTREAACLSSLASR